MSIRLDQVHFAYADTPVVRGVSLSLRAGTLTALIGPNGSGKSTLLRLMLGILRPSQGHVLLDRADPPDVHALPPARRAARIAYLAQDSALAAPMPVRRVVELGRYAVGPDPAAVERALEATDLLPLAARRYHELSTGQRQRVAMARALAQLDTPHPASGKALLADEPASALDPRHTLAAMDLLREAASRGIAVCVVLHDIALAERFADEVAVLKEGGALAYAGAPSVALSPEVLGPVFGVDFQYRRTLTPVL